MADRFDSFMGKEEKRDLVENKLERDLKKTVETVDTKLKSITDLPVKRSITTLKKTWLEGLQSATDIDYIKRRQALETIQWMHSLCNNPDNPVDHLQALPDLKKLAKKSFEELCCLPRLSRCG